MAMKIDDELPPENEFGDGVSWARGPLLGKGAYSRVYKATLKDGRSQYSCLPPEMAVKSADVSYSDTLQMEKHMMTGLLPCPQLIQCFGDELTQGEGGKMAYNLLLEYAGGGTLCDRMNKFGGDGLPEHEVKMHTRSLLRGLNHIHLSGYVHCDLKPDNILLVPRPRKSVTSQTEFKAKIGDFGLAKRAKRSNCKKRKLWEANSCRWRGTPMYLSPEAVMGSEQEAVSDIWALGCVVLRMLTGKEPWEGRDNEEILAKIGTESEIPKIPKKVSKDARHFLRCCFERKPLYRLTADLLLEHPFLDGLGSDDDYEFDEDCGSVDVFEFESDVDDELSCDNINIGSFDSNSDSDSDSDSDSNDEPWCCSSVGSEVPSRYGRHYAVGQSNNGPAVNFMRLLVN
ncbi:mitogen-activated protein kinase kinase kinase 20 [Striga hermonthica]|uniref:Mitogen-activated protein kinase kinase kinase 20 n=1 Tax=Striga hermonthica TaxID=68872 RepID=A0A9N7R408_STRHE|nr:mitogen-activated protein kinase kinase kinase 20 [Striga hermonthica]